MTELSNEWHFSTGSNIQEGPVSRESLLAMRSAGKITDDTLVWSPGMAEWKPFIQIFKAPSKSVPPPLPVVAHVAVLPEASKGESSPLPDALHPTGGIDESGKFLGGIHHPWRRHFARTVDVSTLALFAFLALNFRVGPLLTDKFGWVVNALVDAFISALILLVPWILLESVLLSTMGTTPAKWLFAISVRTTSGHKPSFSQAIERSFRVLVQGIGLGIPIFAFITQFFAYRRLAKTGTTRWDSATGCVVTHKTWGVARATICVVAVLLVFILLGRLREQARHRLRGHRASGLSASPPRIQH